MRALLIVFVWAATASADVTRPVYVGLKEVRAGRFQVTLKRPTRAGRVLSVRPIFLPSSTQVRSPTTKRMPGVEVTTWTVDVQRDATVRIEGPAIGQTETVVRFVLLDGSVYTRVLPPGRTTCAFPFRATPRSLQGSVFDGVEHAARSPASWIFLFGLALIGCRGAIALACGAFLIGRIIAFGPLLLVPPDAALGLAGACVAAGALRGGKTRAVLIALLCGAVQSRASAWIPHIGMSVGTSLTLLASALILAAPLRRVRRPVGYGVGVAGVCSALLVLTAATTTPRQPTAVFAPALGVTEAEPTTTSAPIAPISNRPAQLFLDVGPFETRVEALFHLAPLGLATADDAAALCVSQASLFINGSPRTARTTRSSYVERTEMGVVERASGDWVGVVQSFPTQAPPTRVELRWLRLEQAPAVPVTITDPDRVRSTMFSETSSSAVWADVIALAPIRPIDAEPDMVPISLPATLLGALALLAMIRRRWAAAQVLVASSCLLTPYITVEVPFDRAPSARQTTDVIEALLANVYRSLEQTSERDVYDRLGSSVTAEMIEPLYLEQRRALELGRRGGARVRVESIEVVELRDLVASDGGRLQATVAWEAGGFVVHFGHRHFRRNRYEAKVLLAVIGGSWKIVGLTLRDNQRVR